VSSSVRKAQYNGPTVSSLTTPDSSHGRLLVLATQPAQIGHVRRRFTRGRRHCSAQTSQSSLTVNVSQVSQRVMAPGCRRRCWWPSTSTTSRCTARRASSDVLAWRSRARRLPYGSAPAACSYSRWWTPPSMNCLHTPCCTPMRRRWRCTSRVTARRTARTCGVTAPARSTDQGGGVRLRRQPRRASCQGVYRRLARQARLRRLQYV
jgi:hypothetical protein